MNHKDITPDYSRGYQLGYKDSKAMYNKGYMDACFHNSKLVIIVTAVVLAVSGVLYAIE